MNTWYKIYRIRNKDSKASQTLQYQKKKVISTGPALHHKTKVRHPFNVYRLRKIFRSRGEI
jgi:hypothetical protein